MHMIPASEKKEQENKKLKVIFEFMVTSKPP